MKEIKLKMGNFVIYADGGIDTSGNSSSDYRDAGAYYQTEAQAQAQPLKEWYKPIVYKLEHLR